MNKRNKSSILYTILGILFVSILGTLAHFFYEWSNENKIVALFCPINESVWEHLKLLFFPACLYTIFLRVCFPKNTSVVSAMLIGIFCGLFTIPTLFYTYSGILGKNYAAIDISTFFISVLITFYIAFRLVSKKNLYQYQMPLVLCALILVFCFCFFTFTPPSLAIFRDLS